ncbi:MAG: crossover junction endodeoxyribonuclease RuvC [Deltaproteobacteria bacterium]|nr:crossover junction endodeoxyribonuclease RuvC [Deltaproteobacteria bacterium]
MRVLGIDPGSIKLGYGVVEKGGNHGLVHVCDGVISLNSKLSFPGRLLTISNGINGIIEGARPDAMAVESLFFAKNVRSASILGHVRGVALLSAATFGLPVYEYSPRTVKLAAVGYGGAEKTQIQKMVGLLLKTDAKLKADAADALAVAICHIHHWRPGIDAAHGSCR